MEDFPTFEKFEDQSPYSRESVPRLRDNFRGFLQFFVLESGSAVHNPNAGTGFSRQSRMSMSLVDLAFPSGDRHWGKGLFKLV